MIDEATKNKLIQELEKSGNVYLSCLKVGINKATYYRWLKEDNAFAKKAYQAIRFGRENNCDVAEHSIMLLVKEKNLKASEYILSHNSPRYKPSMSSSKVYLEHKRSSVEPEKSKPKNWDEAVSDYKSKAFEKLSPSDKELIQKADAIIGEGKDYKVSLEDLIAHDNKGRNERSEKIIKIKKRYEKLGGIPPKSDGSKIADEELPEYDGYIEEWYVKRGKVLKWENDTIDFVSFSGRKPHYDEYLKSRRNPRTNASEVYFTDTEDSGFETEKPKEDLQ
jgi:hypothetical protein